MAIGQTFFSLAVAAQKLSEKNEHCFLSFGFWCVGTGHDEVESGQKICTALFRRTHPPGDPPRFVFFLGIYVSAMNRSTPIHVFLNTGMISHFTFKQKHKASERGKDRMKIIFAIGSSEKIFSPGRCAGNKAIFFLALCKIHLKQAARFFHR